MSTRPAAPAPSDAADEEQERQQELRRSKAEAVGSVHDHSFCQSSDGPNVRAEMRGQLQSLRHMEASVSQFAANAAELSSSTTSCGLNGAPVEALLSASELGRLDIANTLAQLADFAENFQHQISRNVVEPLREYHASIGAAQRSARSFDEESESLDAAHLKYLSLSKDSPLETRAHAHGDLCDRAAGVALNLFDARGELREACEAQRVVPQRAVSELLVAQLAYHQSCTRLLTTLMPQVSQLMSQADANEARLVSARDEGKAQRAAMPQPQVRAPRSGPHPCWRLR